MLVLEYAKGGTLNRTLKKEKRFPQEVARMYMGEILLALEALHAKDVIYRDLKPENILFDENGHIILSDLGMARENFWEGRKKGSFCGSPAYMAPEMLKS